MSTEPEANSGRATTASIDRRVERLETAQQETDRKVDRIELELKHANELHKARFDSLDATGHATAAMVGALVQRFDAAVLENTRMIGDPTSTPAGRVFLKDIEELKRGRAENARSISGIKLTIAYASGGLAVVMVVINIFAESIRQAFGIH